MSLVTIVIFLPRATVPPTVSSQRAFLTTVKASGLAKAQYAYSNPNLPQRFRASALLDVLQTLGLAQGVAP